MSNEAKQLTIFFFGQHIAVGINIVLIHHIPVDQVVAHFVRGITEHQNDFLATGSNAAQADRKAVTAQNGEDNAYSFATQFCANVLCNIFDTYIVALSACNDRLGHSNDIPVAGGYTIDANSIQNRTGNDFGQVIALTNNRCANTHRNST